MKRFAILALGCGAIGLAGCGIRGDLERPPPVWGPDQRSEAERAHEEGDEETGDEGIEDAGDWVFEEDEEDIPASSEEDELDEPGL